MVLARAGELIVLDGQAGKCEMDNPRMKNFILLSVLIRELGLQDIDWNWILAENVMEKYVPSTSKPSRWGWN